MWKGLLDGIIVNPSGGRTSTRLPIPDVPGYTIEESYRPAPRIDVETTPLVENVLSANPVIGADGNLRAEIKFDLSPYIRLRGATPPFDISLLGVREYTTSSLSEDWSRETPFVTMDENGIVTYTPRGTYIRNALVIEFDVFNLENPLSPENKQRAQVYDVDEDGGQGGGILPVGGGVPLDHNEIVLQMDGNVIGLGSDDATKFWQNQGIQPTCALVAVSSILLSLGIMVDYQTLLEQASTIIKFDGSGDPLYTVTPGASHLLEYSRPNPPADFYEAMAELPAEYFEYLRGEHTNEELRDYIDSSTLRFPSAATQYLLDILEYRESDTYDGEIVTTSDRVEFNAVNITSSMVAVQKMFEYNGVMPRLGVASDFSTFLQELLAGNPVLAIVDSYEFNNPAMDTIQDQQDRLSALNRPSDLRSDVNHAVWASGIEYVDGVPYVVVVDSAGGAGVTNTDTGTMGGAQLYRLDHFLAAWEDGDFTYVSVGETPAIIQERQAQREPISEAFKEFFLSRNYSPDLAEAYATTNFLESIQDTKLLDIVEEFSPGIREMVIEYLEVVDQDRIDLLVETRIDVDVINSIIKILDVEDKPD